MSFAEYERPSTVSMMNELQKPEMPDFTAVNLGFAGGQIYSMQRYYPQHFPAGYVKEDIRHMKIDLLMGMLDLTHHGYKWLIRFDEKWDYSDRFFFGGESVRKMLLTCEIKRMTSHEEILVPRPSMRPVIWGRLEDYSMRQLLGAMGKRIKKWMTRKMDWFHGSRRDGSGKRGR